MKVPNESRQPTADLMAQFREIDIASAW